MVVYFPVLVNPEAVNVGVQDHLQASIQYMLGRLILNHLKEGNHQIENEPNVDHLYIGCLGEVL